MNYKTTPSLSVVIPTLNEASHLPLCLADLRKWPNKMEIFIVDSGSSDSTILIAKIAGAQIIEIEEPNRGKQLSAGANNVSGDWILFLHADSRLNHQWQKYVLDKINTNDSKNYAWFFTFRVDKSRLDLLLMEVLVAIRSRLFQMPYGDQGLLLRRSLYQATGGYKPLKIMEDVEFNQRLKRKGKLKPIGTEIFTSARKWERINVLSQFLINARLRRLWRRGYHPDLLSKIYYESKSKDNQ